MFESKVSENQGYKTRLQKAFPLGPCQKQRGKGLCDVSGEIIEQLEDGFTRLPKGNGAANELPRRDKEEKSDSNRGYIKLSSAWGQTNSNNDLTEPKVTPGDVSSSPLSPPVFTATSSTSEIKDVENHVNESSNTFPSPSNLSRGVEHTRSLQTSSSGHARPYFLNADDNGLKRQKRNGEFSHNQEHHKDLKSQRHGISYNPRLSRTEKGHNSNGSENESSDDNFSRRGYLRRKRRRLLPDSEDDEVEMDSRRRRIRGADSDLPRTLSRSVKNRVSLDSFSSGSDSPAPNGILKSSPILRGEPSLKENDVNSFDFYPTSGDAKLCTSRGTGVKSSLPIMAGNGTKSPAFIAQVKKRGRLSLGFSLDLSSELGSSKKRSEGAIERGASNYVPESLSERHRKTSGGDGVRVNCSFRLEKTNPIIQGNECGAIKRDNRGSRMPLGFDFDSASNRTEPLKASKFKLRYIRF